ncbi:hypothetical protein MINS_32750 [Mycolicibacterium insubricum]|uniref:Uncharacterized protein n=1 Tax=Mycolicibacterium insubricum TaxID=444597 RepID=A0A1X0DPP2_9MYCO|nr:hypothetical protein BST26_00625 [Mycolicibacterium insubricum]BBZ67846.1 hypothetical protein MINS_32750 [Mycolicibacterium insubricum]
MADTGRVLTDLKRLVAISPPAHSATNAAVREVCATTIGLAPLPAESPGGAVDPMITEFAEQFSADVSGITAAQRAAYTELLGTDAASVTLLIYVADFVPRVIAGLRALGVDITTEVTEWDHRTDPGALLLGKMVGRIGQGQQLDPVTTEVVRLRVARAHNCRLCKSLRETSALDAGASESMYSRIDDYESSDLSVAHKAALRYTDAMIWTPSQLDGAELLSHYDRDAAVELTFDILRNSCNKIAVSLGADAARVAEGTENYRIGPDGLPIYG